jgi:PleD family two-component response regulator
MDQQDTSKRRIRGKVLIVDDDPVVLKVTRDRLERAGYDVRTRSEALGTSVIVAIEKPDVVLLDYSMPGMSGDILAKLLESNPSTRKAAIIFHSGEDLAFLQSRAQALGVTGAIAKTDSERVFLAQFERLFARVAREPRP